MHNFLFLLRKNELHKTWRKFRVLVIISPFYGNEDNSHRQLFSLMLAEFSKAFVTESELLYETQHTKFTFDFYIWM